MSEDPRDDEMLPEFDAPNLVKAPVKLDDDDVVIDETEPLKAETDDVEIGEKEMRDPLSIALVAGIAALLLICVILIFVANRHRPAGL